MKLTTQRLKELILEELENNYNKRLKSLETLRTVTAKNLNDSFKLRKKLFSIIDDVQVVPRNNKNWNILKDKWSKLTSSDEIEKAINDGKNLRIKGKEFAKNKDTQGYINFVTGDEFKNILIKAGDAAEQRMKLKINFILKYKKIPEGIKSDDIKKNADDIVKKYQQELKSYNTMIEKINNIIALRPK